MEAFSGGGPMDVGEMIQWMGFNRGAFNIGGFNRGGLM